ncbi:MAG: KDO2-lipid IV(A) lauroyltransferase [Parvicella sp.]
MGGKIAYYLLILPISRMPFFVLYGLSNFTFFVLYRIVGYRKKVVIKNIKNSFPDKTQAEHKKIMTQFYRHFCDLILESIKGFTISKKQISKRIVFTNNELLDSAFQQNKDLIMVGGHYNNWEYLAVGIGISFKHLPTGIYKPLSSAFFDEKMRTSRGRFGLMLTPMKEAKEMFATDYGRPKAVIFGADQSPSNPNRCYWTEFLNQDTGVFLGPEKFAKEYDLPVFFSTISKVKRGHYEVTHQLITDTPKETKDGEITEAHVKLLEKDINHLPQYWLWTHKRWKKTRPEGM